MLFSKCVMDEWEKNRGREREGEREGERGKEGKKTVSGNVHLWKKHATSRSEGRPDLFHGSLFLPMTPELWFSLALSQGSILRLLARSCARIANVVGEGSAEKRPAVEPDAQPFLKG